MYHRGCWVGGNSEKGEWRRKHWKKCANTQYPLEYYSFKWSVIVHTSIWSLYFYSLLIHRVQEKYVTLITQAYSTSIQVFKTLFIFYQSLSCCLFLMTQKSIFLMDKPKIIENGRNYFYFMEQNNILIGCVFILHALKEP